MSAAALAPALHRHPRDLSTVLEVSVDSPLSANGPFRATARVSFKNNDSNTICGTSGRVSKSANDTTPLSKNKISTNTVDSEDLWLNLDNTRGDGDVNCWAMSESRENVLETRTTSVIITSLDEWFLEGINISQHTDSPASVGTTEITEDYAMEDSRDDATTTNRLRELVSEYGLTLFSPLQDVEREHQITCGSDSSEAQAVATTLIYDSQGETPMSCFPLGSCLYRAYTSRNRSVLQPVLSEVVDPVDESESDDMTDDEEEGDHPFVNLHVEPDSVLSSCPRLLSMKDMQQLASNLPASVQLMRWERAFSIERDGDSFMTMMERCRNYQKSLVVIETSQRKLLGGYCAAPWKSQVPRPNAFFGTGHSFVFCSHQGIPTTAEITTTTTPGLQVYKWAGDNIYCQMFDAEKSQLAMGGGGGNFGWIVEDNFTRGFTDACDTFNNPALVAETSFEIVGFEVYGFKSLGEIYAHEKMQTK